jgi:alkylhydroperoxidase family enzyme
VYDQPRIPPLPVIERDTETQELLAAAGPFAEYNIFTTMVRHRRLYKRWLPYGTAMLYARLPPRDRELLILRTAHRCESDYEWIQHSGIAPDTGLTEAEVEQVRLAPSDGDWSDFDASLLRAVDELIDEHMISDATWNTLAQRYDDYLLIEVPMVVAHYFTVGLTLNTLGVQPEAGAGGQAR